MQAIFIVMLFLWSVLQVTEHNKTSTEMIVIPGGSFTMGKNTSGPSNFKPAHRVALDSFLIDAHPVTNAQYFDFCVDTDHRLPEFWNVDLFKSGEKFPMHPVVGISWGDAQAYATWAGKRLPTEAEWEYAARGGLEDNEFPDGNDWTHPRLKNETGQWENQIIEVSQRAPNGFGIYDMADNVWELVADRYADDYYAQSPGESPKGPDSGYNVVIRGGSWHSGKMCKKVYYRKGIPSNWVDFGVGFRCAKDL